MGMEKKRRHEDLEKISPSASLPSSPLDALKITAPFSGYCAIYNCISRNYCNKQFDNLNDFKLHLKIEHMRLPKNYKQYYSNTAKAKREKK
jgi:hypothetical protein